MRVVAFVPAKGESSRIRNKNTTILDGEHLFKRKLRQLLECKEFDIRYTIIMGEDVGKVIGKHGAF